MNVTYRCNTNGFMQNQKGTIETHTTMFLFFRMKRYVERNRNPMATAGLKPHEKLMDWNLPSSRLCLRPICAVGFKTIASSSLSLSRSS
eukprot:1826026-Amphidinium_carterae.1